MCILMKNVNINNIDFSSHFLFTYYLSADDSLSDVLSFVSSLCDYIPCSHFVISNIVYDKTYKRVCHILLSFPFPLDLTFFVYYFEYFHIQSVSFSYYQYFYRFILDSGVFIDSYD